MVSFSFLNAVDPTTVIFIVLLVVLIVALLVVPMFTNKKRAKQTEELHRSLQPGDVIKTVGGIIGTIKEIRQVSPVDREMVIETGEGDNKSTMTFDIQALYQVMSRANVAPVKAAEAPVQEQKQEVVNTPAEEPAEVKEEPVAEQAAEEPKEEQAAVEEPVVAEEPATEEVVPEEPKMAPKSTGAKKSGGSTGAKKPAAKKK